MPKYPMAKQDNSIGIAFFAEEDIHAGQVVTLANVNSVRVGRGSNDQDARNVLGLALRDAKQHTSIEIAFFPNALDIYRRYMLTHSEG